MKKVNMKQLAWSMVIGCAALGTSCQDAAVAQQEAEYAVCKVSPSDKVLSTMYSATVRGRQDIDIYPQVSGTLTRLCVTEGQKVRKGQTLFIIDQVPYKAALDAAEAAVASAKAAVATAELTYNSRKELYAKKVVSEFDLKTAENSYLTAKAGLAQAQAQATSARNNYGYTTVKSPADGVVGQLPYREGALVSPSGMTTPLTTVSDNSSMYVYFSMTDNQWMSFTENYASKEEAVKAMPEVELILNNGKTYSEKGKVESVSGVVDRSTGTVQLRAVFNNAGDRLLSGTTGNVVIPVERKGCLTIPQAATFEVQDKSFVYKIVDGVATSSPVVVSRVNGGAEYIVEDGLKEGDVIVAEGVGLLREGTPIKAKQN